MTPTIVTIGGIFSVFSSGACVMLAFSPARGRIEIERERQCRTENANDDFRGQSRKQAGMQCIGRGGSIGGWVWPGWVDSINFASCIGRKSDDDSSVDGSDCDSFLHRDESAACLDWNGYADSTKNTRWADCDVYPPVRKVGEETVMTGLSLLLVLAIGWVVESGRIACLIARVYGYEEFCR